MEENIMAYHVDTKGVCVCVCLCVCGVKVELIQFMTAISGIFL
jgi:hypothetical protein